MAGETLKMKAISGETLARVLITPFDANEELASDPDAGADGPTFKLRENGRYNYRLQGAFDDQNVDSRLRLKSNRSNRRSDLGPNMPDAGTLETGTFCGTLVLHLVDSGDASSTPVASAMVEVESVKLAYRTHFRGMLDYLAGKFQTLIADVESSTGQRYHSTLEDHVGEGWMQLQLALLQDAIDNGEMELAVRRILAYPHERLTPREEEVPTDRATRLGPREMRQLVHGQPRREVPTGHPLRTFGLDSVAERIWHRTNVRNLDTPENRFVKYALQDVRRFLGRAEELLGGKTATSGTILARRLGAQVDEWLGAAMFREVGPYQASALGSPVLQRKGGYRELLRLWLRFRTASKLTWEGSEDVFWAGGKNVATLYEYWLFFVLLDWFYKTTGQIAPPVKALIDTTSNEARLNLKRNVELGPFEGQFLGHARKLRAQLYYNRLFSSTDRNETAGSWTRRMRPDYTLSFWPAHLTAEQAEEQEKMVHVHLDAKYRVEGLNVLFGDDKDSDDEEAEDRTTYKRQDLLKMHAYRDAIRRSHGAYILYPGSEPKEFRGYHELLPGLGAFAISPRNDGSPDGLLALEDFLGRVIEHVSNRATAQERVSYHVREAYAERNNVPERARGAMVREDDSLYDARPAMPPSEERVLVAWFEHDEQLELARDKGIVYVRLGKRRGTLRLTEDLSRTRKILLHGHGGRFVDGWYVLTEAGAQVLTGAELADVGANPSNDELIYAVFRVKLDPDAESLAWDKDRFFDLMRRHGRTGSNVANPLWLNLTEILSCLVE